MKRSDGNLKEIEGWHGDLRGKGRSSYAAILSAFVVEMYARKHPCAAIWTITVSSAKGG
jgi:hypothetical protein